MRYNSTSDYESANPYEPPFHYPKPETDEDEDE